MACLSPEGKKEIDSLIEYYLGNAKILQGLANDLGLDYIGGDDSPYVFVDLKGHSSWDTFSTILEECQVVTIPGAGFGPARRGTCASRPSRRAGARRRGAASRRSTWQGAVEI